ncbi:GNAT family N-acetyltransferase [Saliphagus sp. GCM10025308]
MARARGRDAGRERRRRGNSHRPRGTPTDDVRTPTGSETSTDEDEFVGTVRLLEERDEPYLERLAVHPDWQGEGVATTLVDRVEGSPASAGTTASS